jgi:hypothetical protein
MASIHIYNIPSIPNMKNKANIILRAAATLLFCAGTTQAALTWTGATQEAFNSTTFQTLGSGQTAIANFNITGAGAGTVVWGETWTNVSVGPTTVGGITFTATGLGNLTTSAYYTTGTAVLDSGNNNSGNPTLNEVYVTLAGFNPSKEYILQFLIVDDRNNSAIFGRQSMMQELGTANNSGIVVIGTHPDAPAPNNARQFGLITGAFTGGSSVSVETLLSGAGTFNGNMGQVNAIRIVEVIPEPSSSLLLLGSLAGLGLIRRRPRN